MATGLIPHPRALSDGFAAEFAGVMGSIAGASASVAPTHERPEPGWLLEARLDGAAMGVLTLGLAGADAERLVGMATASESATHADSLADVLDGLCGRVVTAFGQQPLTSGLVLIAGGARQSNQTPTGDLVCYRLTVTADFAPVIAVWSHVERAVEAAPQGTPQPDTRVSSAYPANLDVILDIDLPLSVRFGESDMTLDALTKLGPGSVIDLRRSPDDPVDVLVNGRLVARGEVVVVSGNYGVRILEVVSAADRMRTMRA